MAAETEAYQTLLEGVRAHPDSPELGEDLARARETMTIAWLQHTASLPDPERKEDQDG